MYVTITTSEVPADRSAQVEEFLKDFLPRMMKQPGVVGILHYSRPDHGDESTIVVWESRDAASGYRNGDLVGEAIAFEKELGLVSSREGYPLALALGISRR